MKIQTVMVALVALAAVSAHATGTPGSISVVTLSSGDVVVAIGAELHEQYGLAYPVTHQLAIPAGAQGLKAYRRNAGGEPWAEIPEKRAGEFFNGVEAARFAPDEGRAYLSVAFDASSDSLFLRITDSSGTPVTLSHGGIARYYDNRTAVVTCTADDWHQHFADYFRESLSIFRRYGIWVTGGIVTDTGWCTPDTWRQIQAQLDSGYVEAGAHSRNHLFAPYASVGSEVTGARFDIINHLTLPPQFRRGSSEYVYVWIAPYGSYDDAIDDRVGLNKYLVSRLVNSSYYEIAPWDPGTGHYAPIGVAYEIGEATWGGVHDLNTLNSTFDNVVSSGKVYHFMVHPHVLNQYGTWGKDYLRGHLEHIANRTDLWYVALGHLYLYTLVRERLQTTTAIAEDEGLVPATVELSQNYPNPFNPSTTFRFQLPEAGRVGLAVFDALGRKIADIAEGPYEAGVYQATWEAGSGIASGVYFARMTVTDRSGAVRFGGVRRLVLMR